MRLSKILMLVLAIYIAQVACLAPTISYSNTTPIPNDIQIPALVIREKNIPL